MRSIFHKSDEEVFNNSTVGDLDIFSRTTYQIQENNQSKNQKDASNEIADMENVR